MGNSSFTPEVIMEKRKEYLLTQIFGCELDDLKPNEKDAFIRGHEIERMFLEWLITNYSIEKF